MSGGQTGHPSSAAVLDSRLWILVVAGAAGVWAAIRLDLGLDQLVPTSGGLSLAAEFLARAVTPALTYEADVPLATRPLLLRAVAAAQMTVAIAAAAMSVALIGGSVLGVCASRFWLLPESPTGGGRGRPARSLARALHYAIRGALAIMRSVHELFWAVLLLAALGITNVTAVVAIAIPYAAVLAKVFSEIIDETPRDAEAALDGLGATRVQALLFGILPRALSDVGAYAFYRFECALRSSAVLGFLGFPTLGYYVVASFENLHYGEVWTYLYTLFILIAAIDWWSGRLRRGVVA